MSGYDCLNKKRFNSRRTEGAGQRACRNDVRRQSVPDVWSRNRKARLPTVDSLTGGSTRGLALVERSVRRPQASRRLRVLMHETHREG